MCTSRIEITDGLRRAVIAAQSSGVFGVCAMKSETRIECEASNAAAPAFYRLEAETSRLWVSLVTEDRWLSQSIEADLVHTGDKLDELLDEELADQGYERSGRGGGGGSGFRIMFEHFRSEDKLFTFRSIVPVDVSKDSADEIARVGGIFLRAYEACFRRLGDMDAQEGEE
jgi:hypothetical protein